MQHNDTTKTIEKEKTLLQSAYNSFNKRDIDAALANMHADVEWPNGMEGGIEYGHEAVRKYWTRQWTIIDPHVDPINFAKEEDGRINVTVHQVVHDKEGKLLIDQIVYHLYTIENDLIRTMEIKASEQ